MEAALGTERRTFVERGPGDRRAQPDRRRPSRGPWSDCPGRSNLWPQPEERMHHENWEQYLAEKVESWSRTAQRILTALAFFFFECLGIWYSVVSILKHHPG